MKYETPEFEVVELNKADIIQTSGDVILGGGGENETPFNPASVASLDNNY